MGVGGEVPRHALSMSDTAPLSRPQPPTLSYGAMHALACWLALRQGARRWAVYVLMAALLAGAGADLASALAALQALAAWLVLPLFWAVAQGPVWALAGFALHVLAGAGLLLAARQWLWPVSWAEQERALPIAPQAQSRSDLRLIGLALLPWCVLCGGGAAVWLVRQPAWLGGHHSAAALALLAALLGSMSLGLLMQRLRRGPPPPGRLAVSGQPAGPRSRAREVRRGAVLGWCRALLWWPLWRGVAPRSGRAMALAVAGVLTLAAAAAVAPRAAPWWLAAQSLAALVAVSRLKLLTQLELAPLREAFTPLPLSPSQLRAAQLVLAAGPLLLGLAAMVCCVWLVVPAGQLRGVRVLSWAACVASAGAMELRWTQRDAGVRSARWIFMLVLSVAMGSEVWR